MKARTRGSMVAIGVAIVLACAPARAAGPSPMAETLSLLGDTLFTPPLPDSTRTRYQQLLARAQLDYDHDPDQVDNILWLGRRTAYLGRFREAIAIYTRGIELHPDEPRLYRHRGHRYLTLRMFELAQSDLERAAALARGRTDQVEPDGLPNARNIPTTTLRFNIWYHLALAHYLTGDFDAARRAYRQCLMVSTNPDMRVATSYWLYLTLRRLGRHGEARGVLKPIRAGMDVIENRSYLRLLLVYRGALPADSLGVRTGGDPVEDATIGYGLGAWRLLEGRTAEADSLFRRIVAAPQWPAFGHIAAEADLARTR